jgi:hypothetical protein
MASLILTFKAHLSSGSSTEGQAPASSYLAFMDYIHEPRDDFKRAQTERRTLAKGDINNMFNLSILPPITNRMVSYEFHNLISTSPIIRLNDSMPNFQNQLFQPPFHLKL